MLLQVNREMLLAGHPARVVIVVEMLHCCPQLVFSQRNTQKKKENRNVKVTMQIIQV